jgi:hypothetical protein
MSAAQRGAGAWVATGSLAPATPMRTAYDTPCGHTDCGATPTRLYGTGHRCPVHTPAAIAGRPENRPDPALSGLGMASRVLPTLRDPARYGRATDSPRLQADGRTPLPAKETKSKRKGD